ncbi:TadE family protein, partial [Luedemannella flava]|uniref:TadE family protein n=1 Tax=Luedemannella flava TaxID=349316 RepID=UPI0031DB5696
MEDRKVRWADRPTAPPHPRSPAGTGPRNRRPRTGGRDKGAATVEIAVALPVLVLLTFVAIGAVNAVLARVRCVDAARDAA